MRLKVDVNTGKAVFISVSVMGYGGAKSFMSSCQKFA